MISKRTASALLFSSIVLFFGYFYQPKDYLPQGFSAFKILPFVLLLGMLVFTLAIMNKRRKTDKS